MLKVRAGGREVGWDRSSVGSLLLGPHDGVHRCVRVRGCVAASDHVLPTAVAGVATRGVLCKSVGGLWVQYVRVTAPGAPPEDPRPLVVVLARQHPGETVARWGVVRASVWVCPCSGGVSAWPHEPPRSRPPLTPNHTFPSSFRTPLPLTLPTLHHCRAHGVELLRRQ